jgi:hypothetical protein
LAKGFLSIEDKDKLKGDISVVAYGTPVSCTTTYKYLLKGLEKAKKKEKYKDAIEWCEELLRRYPNSEEYKKEWADLNAKLH